MTISALILAGSRPGGPDAVASAEGVAHKALADVGGQPILARVIAALRGAGIEYIAVAADQPEVVALAETLGARVLPPQSGPSASVAAGFAELGAPMLVTTADHALLRPEWVRAFLADVPEGSDVAIMLARQADVERAMPGSRRTWLRFADGGWSGCNLFLIATARGRQAISTWEAVERDRKRPWRIAARLGPGTLLNYALGRLTLDGAVARLGARIGLVAHAVAARDGLAAVDVDKPGDLADVRRILGA
ncbi:MAG: nucleotidyltransferase family protein [Novosphingobium sp.]